jgi:manganese/zinc/iron transport system permease protein
VLWRARRLAADRRRALVDGVLVDLDSAVHAGPPPTEADLHALGSRSRRALRRGLRELERSGMLARDGDCLRLSERGAQAAHALLERRDLWAAWLEHGSRLELPDAREPDPRDLPGTLGEAAVARLRVLAGGAR